MVKKGTVIILKVMHSNITVWRRRSSTFHRQGSCRVTFAIWQLCYQSNVLRLPRLLRDIGCSGRLVCSLDKVSFGTVEMLYCRIKQELQKLKVPMPLVPYGEINADNVSWFLCNSFKIVSHITQYDNEQYFVCDSSQDASRPVGCTSASSARQQLEVKYKSTERLHFSSSLKTRFLACTVYSRHVWELVEEAFQSIHWYHVRWAILSLYLLFMMT